MSIKTKNVHGLYHMFTYLKIGSELQYTYPQPITTRLRLSRSNKILNESDITSIKVYHK